jgi:hypothetical protein
MPAEQSSDTLETRAELEKLRIQHEHTSKEYQDNFRFFSLVARGFVNGFTAIYSIPSAVRRIAEEDLNPSNEEDRLALFFGGLTGYLWSPFLCAAAVCLTPPENTDIIPLLYATTNVLSGIYESARHAIRGRRIRNLENQK